MAKRILVPISHNRPADSLLTMLGDLARGAGATMRLLHVAAPTTNIVDDDGRVLAYADQEWSRVEAEARDFLETISFAIDGPAVETAVGFGEPGDGILESAREFGADLIVLGVGSRRRFLRVGGIVEQVLRHAEAPVAVIRPGHDETDPTPLAREVSHDTRE